MQLKFSANQEHQLEAIQTVVELFEGQQAHAGSGGVELDSLELFGVIQTDQGVANHSVLPDEQWLLNCQKVQGKQGLVQSERLEYLTLASGEQVGDFPNFTIEMETGTGKTYTYLRTIYELHRAYGFKKFVIVVPSVAIREGVLKNLQITHEHFQALYDYEPVHFSVYDSGNVQSLRNFAVSNTIQILVINIDAFARDATESPEADKRKSKGNIINQMNERGTRPIEFLQASRPIVFIDEPQNIESDIRKQAIARLHPLCTLRYSATPRNAYNLVYRLDPVRAYQLGLVKQIGVDSVVEVHDQNQAYIEVESFKTTTRSVSAKMRIWVNGNEGADKKSVTVKNGDDLFTLSGERETYRDRFIINEIDADQGFVRFANDLTVRLGQPQGALTDEILKFQIEVTIRRHFEKELQLRKHGIKVLSVFFIDRVAHYRELTETGEVRKGKFALWFEELYDTYRNKPEYQALFSFDAEMVHNGYFAQDKRVVTPFEVREGKSKSEAETSTFELIMRDKERLLDLEEPLRFIFSHSALREGWDNPNVFQICTLAESSKELKKRQEIGRGLRLCVNNRGERVVDKSINHLTIIANESYEDFAKTLQIEFEDSGLAFKPEMIKNERNKVQIRLKKGYDTDVHFLALWERIKQKTRYLVRYSTEELIEGAVEALHAMAPIKRPMISVAATHIAITEQGVTGVGQGMQTGAIEARYAIPDLLAQIQAKTSLSRSTVAAILLNSKRLGDAMNNPQAFVDRVAELINGVKRNLMVRDVEYVRAEGHEYEMCQFEQDDLREVFESNVVAVGRQEKTLFSHLVMNSNDSLEREFAERCEQDEDVLFYMKLPRWFKIDTPVGPYTPDWAVVYKGDQTFYFVVETKDRDLLSPVERQKIECGERHFKTLGDVTLKDVRGVGKWLAFS